jgi:hypothetical protein
MPKTKQKKTSVTFSPQANYTDWATATGSRILVPTFVDRGMSRGQRGGTSTAVNLTFLDRDHYPHEAEWTSSRTHCYAENLVSPGIETRSSGLSARNSDH